MGIVKNIKIEDYGMNCEGVGKVDGKVVLVDSAVKGEIVDVCITKDFSNYSLGKLDKIILQSENRRKPLCPYFTKCGGCDLQHILYNEQLKFKKDLIRKTIKKISNLDVEVLDTVSSNFEFNYRNKISLNFNKGNLGFFSKNSKENIKIEKCLISNKKINEIINFLNTIDLSSISKVLKNVVIRSINDCTLIGFVCKDKADITKISKALINNFENIGIYLIVNKRNDSVVLYGDVYHIGGVKEIKISDFDIDYSIDLMGFHQTNIDIQDKLYKEILNNINVNEVIVNGFSGQGLLSAILAKKAKKVIGIEINKSSHNSAENLKKSNKIKNLYNICGDFNKEIKKIKDFSTLVLDPSKKGLGEICKNFDFKKIIYVSCNPVALAKDLRELKEKYAVKTIIPFDMFPNTKDVETLVILEKI